MSASREFGPWLTAESAARFLDYPATSAGVKAFREWARRAGVPTAHRGRRVLYGRDDLLASIGVRARTSPRRLAAPQAAETVPVR